LWSPVVAEVAQVAPQAAEPPGAVVVLAVSAPEQVLL